MMEKLMARGGDRGGREWRAGADPPGRAPAGRAYVHDAGRGRWRAAGGRHGFVATLSPDEDSVMRRPILSNRGRRQ